MKVQPLPVSSQGGCLWNNYGAKSNEELLCGYGFVLPHNTANFFHVSMGLDTAADGGGCGIHTWHTRPRST